MSRPWVSHYDPGVPHDLEVPELAVHGFLARSAVSFTDRPALRFYGKRISYAALHALSSRFASALQALGVKKGDRVALHLPNCPQFVIAYFGALRAGAVVTSVSPLYVPSEIEHICRDSGAETLVTLPRFYPRVHGVRRGTALRRIVVTGIQEHMGQPLRALFTLFREKKEGDRIRLEPGDLRFAELMAMGSPSPQPVDVAPADLALLQYTGGTTGVPKAAMLTHRNLVANMTQVQVWIRRMVSPGRDSVLAVLPLFHLYGMAACLNVPVLFGAEIILLPRFELREVVKTLHRCRPTLFPGVPTMYIAINQLEGAALRELRGLKFCLSGAAPLPLEVQQEFERHTGCRMAQGYGLTETSPVLHMTLLEGETPLGSTGLPVPGTDVRIVDVESGARDLGPGEAGEIVVRGPQVMQGYWNKPEETAHVLRDGWFFTGDIGVMDARGFLTVTDRKKDMIISGGVNVFPREVEEILFQHPGVQEAAVIGIPDAYWGEALKAFVVPRAGATLTADDVLAFCKERLAKFKVPKQVELRKELPKSLIGKVLRRALREEEAAKRKQLSP